KLVLAYLKKVDPKQVPARASLINLLDPTFARRAERASADEKRVLVAAAGQLVSRFDTNREEYARRSSQREWMLARQHARVLEPFAEMQASSDLGYAVRDRSMAENIRWILEYEGPGTKMVTWAHNWHVATRTGWMGSHLREALGRDMVVFGFAFYQGGF